MRRTAQPLRRGAYARPRCLVPGHVRRRYGHQQGFRPGCRPRGAYRTGTEARPAAGGERARTHPGRGHAGRQPSLLPAAVTRLPGAAHCHRATCAADSSTRPRRASGRDRLLLQRGQRERPNSKLGLVGLERAAGSQLAVRPSLSKVTSRWAVLIVMVKPPTTSTKLRAVRIRKVEVAAFSATMNSTIMAMNRMIDRT
jgi:hypothetical protein